MTRRGRSRDVTAYERNSRRAFRLPDPDQVPGAYLLARQTPDHYRRRQGNAEEYPAADATSAIAAAPAPQPVSTDGPVIVAAPGGDTRRPKLQARQLSPWMKPASPAAALVLLAVTGFVSQGGPV